MMLDSLDLYEGNVMNPSIESNTMLDVTKTLTDSVMKPRKDIKYDEVSYPPPI